MCGFVNTNSTLNNGHVHVEVEATTYYMIFDSLQVSSVQPTCVDDLANPNHGCIHLPHQFWSSNEHLIQYQNEYFMHAH